MPAYPSTLHDLNKALAQAYEEGPGAEPGTGTPLTACIVPDGTLTDTGSIAAWAYHALGDKAPPLFILVQQGSATGTSMRSWETPIGTLRADPEFIMALTQKGHIRLDDEALETAEAIHAQLPFIASLTNARIAPITVADDPRPLALDIKETLTELGRRAVIIATSTLTRHGPRFRYVRFTLDPPRQVRELDEHIIKHLTTADEFLAFSADEHLTLSGEKAIALLLGSIPPSRAKPLVYEQRGEKNITGLATIVFEDSRGVTNI